MTPSETKASLRILLAMAHADGNFHIEERDMLTAIADQLGVPLGKFDGVDLDHEMRHLVSEEAKDVTYRAAVAVANVDGRCSAEEHALLLRLHGGLAPNAALPVASTEREWVERMRGVRQGMRQATDGFLKKLVTSGAALDHAAYEKLVDELHAKKKALVSGALTGEKK